MKVVLSRREFYAALGDAVQDQIEAELEGTDPARAPIRRALRRAEKKLLMSDDVDRTHPDTRAGIADLVAIGFMTQQAADVLLYVAPEDMPPTITQPDGTIEAFVMAERVWARQAVPGEPLRHQLPDGDLWVTHPDYLVVYERGGAVACVAQTDITIP